MLPTISSSHCKWPEECELATAYVPYQTCLELYSPNEALKRGTIFPCLYNAGYSQLGDDCYES